jgi:hypothetical protein
MATAELGIIDGQHDIRANEGLWLFDDDDWALMAQLQDPIMCAELLFEDPLNREYSGCYHVRDYQYPLFRPKGQYNIDPCARDVGKTESIKARAVSHAFKRIGEDLLLSAPQLIHLEPLTQAVEDRINSVRLTRDFLKRDSQKTGFTHKPFQCDFADGTRIIGRIPHLTGTGVKGQHVPDLIIDEAQDYPEAGWTEVFPTVMKDHTDSEGNYDFTMTFYGVHAAGQGGTFGRLAKSPSYKLTTVTRLQTPKWGKEEKEATAAMYGGTNSPDYRRNVLGEPGQAFSQFFVTSRLMACMDQDKESRYNTQVFRAQELQAEEVDSMLGPGADPSQLLDLPENLGQQVYGGMDLGLVTDPTVIMLFAVAPDAHRKSRLQLVRMIHLWRFREKQIRQVTYRIARQYGITLRAFGQDITGLGLPLYQAMEDDEECPRHLKDVSEGYVFNAKVPVSVDPNYVSEQGDRLVDQYGNMVERVRDKWTGQESLVAKMTMIEASTRYLRGFVDSGWLLLPFHEKLIADFQGETEQRVKAMAGVRKKPNAFHMLDAARAFAMAFKQGEVQEQVYSRPHGPVLDRAVTDMTGPGATVMG